MKRTAAVDCVLTVSEAAAEAFSAVCVCAFRLARGLRLGNLREFVEADNPSIQALRSFPKDTLAAFWVPRLLECCKTLRVLDSWAGMEAGKERARREAVDLAKSALGNIETLHAVERRILLLVIANERARATPDEFSRMALVATLRHEGKTIAETARAMDVSEKTVARLWAKVRDKTGARRLPAGRPGLKFANMGLEQAEREKARGGRTPHRGSKDGARD